MDQDSAPPAGPSRDLQAAIAQIWEKSLPLLRQRVSVLENAVAGIAAGHLDKELRMLAGQESHRLAGLLGTFGHPHGTDAARMLEIVFDGDTPIAPELAESLAPALITLREIVGE
jgi:hypothetical protein